jgi:hypothetical protein
MLVGLPASNKWGRLVGLWLCYFQGLGFSMSLTMVSSNVAGYTKKQCTGTILFVGYCVGNIIGKCFSFSFPHPSPSFRLLTKVTNRTPNLQR